MLLKLCTHALLLVKRISSVHINVHSHIFSFHSIIVCGHPFDSSFESTREDAVAAIVHMIKMQKHLGSVVLASFLDDPNYRSFFHCHCLFKTPKLWHMHVTGECLSPVKGPTKTWGGAAPLAKPSMPFAGGSRQVVFGEINWKHTLRNKKK